MTTDQLADDAIVLATRIPERVVRGLVYGAHVSRENCDGYYVRLSRGRGSKQWCIAWQTPEDCRTDKEIRDAIRDEIDDHKT